MLATASPTLIGLPLSLDPIACLLGLVAIWLAWIAYRSSSYHLIRIEDLKAGWVDSVRSAHCGPYLEVSILNLGLPIHDLKVCLQFQTDEEVPMQWTTELSPTESISNVPFDRGMRGQFIVRPLQFTAPEHFEAKIRTLRDPKRQQAAIVVKSGNFVIKTIPLVSMIDGPLQRWNELALTANLHLMKTIKVVDGITHAKTRDWLPVFGLRASHWLKEFAEVCTGMVETDRKFKSRRTT